VAREAVGRGAVIINDISALQFDPAMGEAAAATGAALVLMHNRGRSTEMYARAVYRDVGAEVASEIDEAIRRATDAGVSREALMVDPGFGFSKRAEHTYEALARMDRLAELDRPILAGPSRKSFLKLAIGERPPDDREWATAAAVTASVLFGAHIVRVHGVAAMADVVRVADRIRGSVTL
jgi:dihydropteroate synthase